uniref:Endo/exonuclease/phosphatase domain-containing protein n=1 Tax=Enterobius vermicularis TaxID=51028 RepID=A0A0N4UY82_ENTVE
LKEKEKCVCEHTGVSYKPSSDDIGKYVSVIIDLGEDTIKRFAVTKNPVAAVPEEQLIFEERQNVKVIEVRLRVMSYNILADLYLNLRQPQDDLFFPYCPKVYQEYAYRYPLLLREIPGYNADLIFLQEVDERFRRRFLLPYMEELGYETRFKKKGLAVTEGLAICFRKDKLRFVLIFLNVIPSHLIKNVDIINYLDQNLQLKEHFFSRPAVIQLLLLGSTTDEDVLLMAGNTHLHYDPQEENIKVMQALLCARHIAHKAQELQLKHPNGKIYKLLAGDFNSTPDGPVYDLISKGILGTSVSTFLNPMLSLVGDPPYTNYTRFTRNGDILGFSGCLDYIWGDPGIKVVQTIPMPSDELVKKHTALPSVISPSDHLPLICDILLQ